ncbi:hypothetical protein [Castellaniella sp.]|nr:hypothetical protein [Castellaniella sp.]
MSAQDDLAWIDLLQHKYGIRFPVVFGRDDEDDEGPLYEEDGGE